MGIKGRNYGKENHKKETKFTEKFNKVADNRIVSKATEGITGGATFVVGSAIAKAALKAARKVVLKF